MAKKAILGLTERVTVYGKKRKVVTARIDTGATKSSIDAALAAELQLGPIVGKRLVKSASGVTTRPVIKVKIKIKGVDIERKFTIAERSHMKYKILIGQNILKKGFMIDPSKK